MGLDTTLSNFILARDTLNKRILYKVLNYIALYRVFFQKDKKNNYFTPKIIMKNPV